MSKIKRVLDKHQNNQFLSKTEQSIIVYNYSLDIEYMQLSDPDKPLWQTGSDYFTGTESEFDKWYKEEYTNEMYQKCLGIKQTKNDE
jgi:hypothetical protein